MFLKYSNHADYYTNYGIFDLPSDDLAPLFRMHPNYKNAPKIGFLGAFASLQNIGRYAAALEFFYNRQITG
jgi:hypothetical protein